MKVWSLVVRKLPKAALSLLILLPATLSASEPVVSDNRIVTDDRRIAILEGKLASLMRRIELLEDAKEIERLQQAYGYYISEGMGREAAALFADNPTASIEVGQQGVYIGKARIRQYLTHRSNRLEEGEIRETPIMQGVIHVSVDGRTAKARWRALQMGGSYGQDGTWTEGPFENEYVKENGIWKIQTLHWYTTVAGSYDEGWHKQPLPVAQPLPDLPPDRGPSVQYQSFPAFFLPPYHYPHPVTGEPVAWD